MAKQFSLHKKIRHHPERAAQVWQILVAAAMDRRTMTYLGLSELMYGRPASGVLDAILGHVAHFCNEHSLPPLTSIVVNKATGVPGDGIPIENLPNVREEVYDFDWFDILAPTPKQLKKSYERNAT